MTTPTPPDGHTLADDNTAIDGVRSMLLGTKMLPQQPGVVVALAQQNAQAADAQAVDQFMQGMDLEKQVRLHIANGSKMLITPDNQRLLDGMGVDYSGVQFTQQDAVNSAVKQIEAQGHTVQRNPDGTLKLDKSGNIIVAQDVKLPGDHTVSAPVAGVNVALNQATGDVAATQQAVNEPQAAGYTAKGIGRLFHTLHNDVLKPIGRDVLKPTLGGLNRAWNVVNYNISGPTTLAPGAADDMTSQGYNPDSLWSRLAYESSGHAHMDTTSLVDQYGRDKVDQATAYLNDPQGFLEKLNNDPNNFVKTADGQTAVTPAAAAKIAYYTQSDEFHNLTRQLAAKDQNIGNAVLGDLKLDPVKHAMAFNIASAGINLAASFMLDPTLAVAKVAKVAKLSQIGSDVADSQRAAFILDPGAQRAAAEASGNAHALDVANSGRPTDGVFLNGGVKGTGLRTRWQNAIDTAGQIRTATDAGDTATAAKLTAQFASEHKELSPILSDMIGLRRFDGYVEDGAHQPVPTFTTGPAWSSLADAANWMASKNGMTRLMNGRAAVQASLMPGAVSNFGLRKLKGLTAGWMTERSVARQAGAEAEFTSKVLADPGKFRDLISDQDLARMQAAANDAVDSLSETPISSSTTQTALASQARAEALSPAQQGDIVRNLRASGSPLGDQGFGWSSPNAITARARLAAQRLSTQLPRSTVFDINASTTGDELYRFALTYLHRGDANTFRTAWNTADEGTKKALYGGLLDQVAHAAGLPQTGAGSRLLDSLKTQVQSYSSVHDEVSLNGQNLAQWEGQIRPKYFLPSFRELHMTAQKLGAFEATLGRVLTRSETDMLMAQWKMNALFKPSTITRNMLEGWLRTAVEGKAGEAIQARIASTTPNAELWAHGIETEHLDSYRNLRGEAETLRQQLATPKAALTAQEYRSLPGFEAERQQAAEQLRAASTSFTPAQRADMRNRLNEAERKMALIENKPIVQHGLALEAGDHARAKLIERSSMLTGQALGRGQVSTKVAAFLSPIGQAFRMLFGRYPNEEVVKAILDYGTPSLSHSMENFGILATEADLGVRGMARQATHVAEAGFGPSRLKMSVKRALTAEEKDDESLAWVSQPLDGIVGSQRYTNELARRVNAQPDVARAILDRMEDPHATLQAVIDRLDESSRHTAYGHVVWDDGAAEARRPINPDEVALGKRQWAQKMVDDFSHLLVGQNGHYQQDLADYIREHGKAPDADWVSTKLTGDNRPETALAPDVSSQLNGSEPSVIGKLLDVEGAAYQWAVERVLQRTTTGPVFLAHYGEARVALKHDVAQIVEGGLSQEAADNLARDLAERNAMLRMEQLIDDPGQKTQFDVVARNIFPFARATQAMIRRWGGAIWRDPAAARKMMLAYEGAVHSGFVYNNIYGEPTFVYPGSGVMNMAMRELAKVPGFENFARFPVSSSMTGGVLMSVPGADNPLRMSMGPMIAIPMREVFKHVFPASMRASLDEFDSYINGPIGVGETWSQLVPTAVRKFYVAMNGDERNSALASSMVGAIANLAAAGRVSPPDASPEQRDKFIQQVRGQVQSQLFLRAIFGLVAPAAPSTPSEGTSASQADYAFQHEGIGQLADEYKTILNEVGGDVGRANAVWTALHPDKFVYKDGALTTATYGSSAFETGHSVASASKAVLPATREALNWMAEHQGFIKDYKNVAAYFLPEAAANAPFSDQAYKTQLELGLRQRKTPTGFLDDLRLRHAESLFFPSVKQFDVLIANAKTAGDTATESQYTQLKSDWETEFKSINPLLQQKTDSYSAGRATALQQLANLNHMVKTNAVPDGQGKLLSQLIGAYDGYETFVKNNPGSDNYTQQMHTAALGMFNQWATANIAGTPLVDLYNGVFGVLNTNIVKL